MTGSKPFSGSNAVTKPELNKKTVFFRRFLFWITIVVALFFLVCGVLRAETSLILNKAVRICLECIGIG